MVKGNTHAADKPHLDHSSGDDQSNQAHLWKTDTVKASMGGCVTSCSTARSSTRLRGANPDRTMEETLQYHTTTLCFGLPPTGPGNHRADGPEANHVLATKPDRSGGADKLSLAHMALRER